MESNQPVRVRVAPSPTGDPHVGTAYVALFNLAFARKHGGQFLLRIEDTDQSRARSESEAQIISTLKWLGLNWDEGPDAGGPHGPYRQSERREIYTEHVQQLLKNASAYRCFCSSERLDQVRAEKRQKGEIAGYDRHCRQLSEQESSQRAEAGETYVVRLKMPLEGELSFHDQLRGEVVIAAKQLDDQVLLKSDGLPTYHLANVVDDHLMGISHVIRAEEWISSTPKHVILYKAFGWQEPQWIHLPLLRNSDKSKISKRKNPVSLEYYRRAGILPQALLNYLGTMGWSYGDDQEIFSLAEMIEVFDMKKISLGGPVFDMAKLNWMNHQYMQQISDQDFLHQIKGSLLSDEYLLAIKPLILERMQRFDEFVDRCDFFFNGALDYNGLALIPKNKEAKDMRHMIKDVLERLDNLDGWHQEAIHEVLTTHMKELDWKPRDYLMPLRLMITGRKDSPPLMETIAVLGREIVRFRLRHVLQSQLG